MEVIIFDQIVQWSDRANKVLKFALRLNNHGY